MIDENDYIPLSALQHWVFCRRQCALIHMERLWVENAQTADGRCMHSRAHDESLSMENGLLVARGLWLSSHTLCMVGKADVVEYHPSNEGLQISGYPGFWRPYPVEYKRGQPKKHQADEIQLCAQAICLEEMLSISITCGALFYGKIRRRTEISFTPELRNSAITLSMEIRDMMNRHELPSPEFSEKCNLCSFIDICQPGLSRTACSYFKRMIKESVTNHEDS